jgi:erythromycin esterase
MKYIILFLFALKSLHSHSQNTISWLQKNVIPISTTDQYVNNSKEYEPLKKILQGKDIILLGEEDHIFATTFESKTKLIKFLHDEMGFTVLAFEYDLYSLANSYNKAIKENNATILQNSIWPFWGKAKSTESLFPYVLSTAKNSALKVIGFDCQTFAEYPFIENIDSYLTAKKSLIIKYPYYLSFTKIFKQVYKEASTYQYKINERQKLLLFNVLDDILFEMNLDTSKTNQIKILKQALQNFKNNINSLWLDQPSNYSAYGLPIPDTSIYGFVASRQSMGSYNRRDKLMAENIKWIKEVLYPGEKIIIWAASEHTIYNRHLANFHNILVDTSFAFHSRFKYNKEYKTMGTYVKDYYGEKVYNLGFTTLGGQVDYDRSGNSPSLAELSVGENSLESFFVKLKTKNGILNLDKKKLPAEIADSTLYHNIIGGYPNMSGNISTFFDGIFFIRTMKPITYFRK